MITLKCLAMLSSVVIIVLAISLTSCVADPVSKEWISIIPNGDKPGIGIVLTETSGLVNSGFFYTLDPNDLQTFSKGRRYKLAEIKQTGQIIRCGAIVDDDSIFTKTKTLDMTISFQSDFHANQVNATLKSGDGQLRPIVFSNKK